MRPIFQFFLFFGNIYSIKKAQITKEGPKKNTTKRNRPNKTKKTSEKTFHNVPSISISDLSF